MTGDTVLLIWEWAVNIAGGFTIGRWIAKGLIFLIDKVRGR